MKHYVYIITHKITKMKYIGVRTDEHLGIPDILTGNYNTSSKDEDFVKEFTDYRINFDIEIEFFESRLIATKVESWLLKFYDAKNNPDFYNKSNGVYSYELNSNKVGIHKGNRKKLINQSDLDAFIAQGWSLGYGEDFSKLNTLSQGSRVEAFIQELDISLGVFESASLASIVTGVCRSSINCAAAQLRNSAGTYDIDSKEWNTVKVRGSLELPNSIYKKVYKVRWRYLPKLPKLKLTKEQKKNQRYLKTSIKLEAFISEINFVICQFNSAPEASSITGRHSSTINQCSLGLWKTCGTYDIETKEWNKFNHNPRHILPNKDYPTTYRVSWRQLK